MAETKAPPAPPCPACESARVVPVAFGMPGPDLQARANRREVVLGGCMVWGDERDPKWACLDCNERLAKDGTSIGDDR
jgi:hypothetical protein